MIPARPIQTLLAATDLRTTPEEFLRNAAEVAMLTGAELHVVHTHQDGSVAGVGARDWLDTQKEIHQRRAELRDLLESAMPAGMSARSFRVRPGSPPDEILASAVEHSADLIVLGPHRQRPIGDRYLGSTAERVLREARVPCLILNGAISRPIERILVPADFSAPSRSALRCGIGWVRMLSERGAVEIDFVHVVSQEAGATGPQRMAELKAQLESEVQEVAEDAALKVPVSVEVLEGSEPADELIRYGISRGAGLVVMGTRSDTILMRALLGSVSSTMLRRSEIPLLLVPPLAFPELRESEAEMDEGTVLPEPLSH